MRKESMVMKQKRMMIMRKIKSIGLMLTVAGLVLMLQTVFASNHEYDVVCDGIWYIEGTNCNDVKKSIDLDKIHKESLTTQGVDELCDASEDYVKNKEECDLMYEEVERNEAGDHWIGGVTPDEFVDADKESDLLYGELCTYNDGKWKNNKCEFDDDAAEEKYEKKL